MLATIEFNDQFLLKADQIYDIWPQRLLSAELMPAQLPTSKMLPQRFFLALGLWLG